MSRDTAELSGILRTVQYIERLEPCSQIERTKKLRANGFDFHV